MMHDCGECELRAHRCTDIGVGLGGFALGLQSSVVPHHGQVLHHHLHTTWEGACQQGGGLQAHANTMPGYHGCMCARAWGGIRESGRLTNHGRDGHQATESGDAEKDPSDEAWHRREDTPFYATRLLNPLSLSHTHALTHSLTD